MPAITNAFFIVMAFAPTEVPNAFATSFAPILLDIQHQSLPIPKAQKKATTVEKQGIHWYWVKSTVDMFFDGARVDQEPRILIG